MIIISMPSDDGKAKLMCFLATQQRALLCFDFDGFPCGLVWKPVKGREPLPVSLKQGLTLQIAGCQIGHRQEASHVGTFVSVGGVHAEATMLQVC